MKSTYQEQKDKGNLPISLYVDKDKKEQWEAFAKSHGMNIKGLISNSVDYFILNSDKVHTEAPSQISNKDIEETRELVKMLSKKLDSIPSIVQMALSDALTNNKGGFTYQALVNQPDTKDRIRSILEASKQRVLMPDTLKAALPDIEDVEIYNTLNQLVKDGKAEKTNLGWRRKS